ncbi:MAG: hypothetical protein PIR53_17655 [Nocardioides alkalitolerans]
MSALVMQSVLWSALAIVNAHGDRRFQGEAGRRHLLEMSPGDAWSHAKQYRSPWTARMFYFLAAAWSLGAVTNAAAGEWGAVPFAVPVVATTAYAARSHQRTAPTVLAVLAERDDEPRPPPAEDRSARRRRRTRQFLVAAGALYAASSFVLIIANSWNSQAGTTAGVALIVAGTLALVGAGWARAWRYGDEEPA